MTTDAKWNEWSDEQLREAGERIKDYTPEAQRAISAELAARGLPVPLEKPDAPSFFTVPTRAERIFGRLALVGGLLTGLFFLFAILGGARVGIFGALLAGVLISAGFGINRSMQKGTPFSNLKEQLESEHARYRVAAASLLTRIEPAGRAAAIEMLESVATGDPDQSVRQAATAAIGKLDAARAT